MEAVVFFIFVGIAVVVASRLKSTSRRAVRRIVHDTLTQGRTTSIRSAIGPTPRPVGQIHGRAYVVDGDTIAIAGTQVRLSGIDAPEIDHPYGIKAKQALMRLCKGMAIRAEVESSDAHGRTVATCFLPDGRDLSAEMVRQGHAVDWPKYSGGTYRALEVPGIRKRLWRCDARQKGRTTNL